MCVICKNEESKFMMSGLPGKICTEKSVQSAMMQF